MSEASGRVSLYLADIRPLYDPVLAGKVYERLDDVRRKKADLCRKPEARAASLAVGFLARYSLEDAGYADFRILYEPGGRPMVETDGPPVFLSLSHSGDYAVCAVSQRPVGVDLQKRQSVKAGVLRLFYSERQAGLFRKRYGIGESGIMEGEALDRFLREWTVKESYMKMTGKGMKMGFADLFVEKKKKTVVFAGKEGGPAVFREYDALDGYFLSACTAVN